MNTTALNAVRDGGVWWSFRLNAQVVSIGLRVRSEGRRWIMLAWIKTLHRDAQAAVAIIAVTDEGEMLMVKQKRGSFGEILEVPAWKVDAGEDPEVAVKRELLEETGYKADNIFCLNNSLLRFFVLKFKLFR